MFCPKCGESNPDSNNFCAKCGNNLRDLNTQTSQSYVNPIIQKAEEYNNSNKGLSSRKKSKRKKECIIAALIPVTILFIIVIFAIVDLVSNPAEYEETTTAITEQNSTEPGSTISSEQLEKIYKSACKSLTYNDLARNPTSYVGKKVKLRGQILQVSKALDTTVYLVNITDKGYGIWDDTVYMTFNISETSSQLLEDDVIQFYGIYMGTTSYETLMGENRTVPFVSTEYVDLEV